MRVITGHSTVQRRGYVVLRDGETITLRVFRPTIDGGTLANSEQIDDVLTRPIAPFMREPSQLGMVFPPELFAAPAGSQAYEYVGGIGWSPDPAFYGSHVVADRTTWAFIDHFDSGPSMPINMTLESVVGRYKSSAVFAQRSANVVLTICQPYADSPLNDCTMFLRLPVQGNALHHNLGQVQSMDPTMWGDVSVWPRIRLSGPATLLRDQQATVEVETWHPTEDRVDERANGVLFLEDVEGYTPNRRVQMRDGRGSFRVAALGLQVGERVRVKIGWRYWPGVSEYIAAVE